MESQSETTQTVSALKLPILKTGDYDLWSMRMEQYLTHTDYALWEVIVNGNAPAVASASAEGPIPPKTAEQKLARKNELKAKSTLLLAIPDEHLLKFHEIKDAKTLWEAIKTRSEGLDKTYDRFQKLISQLEIHADLDGLSMDDLYNNLKVYEAEIKSQSSSSLKSQNVAFVSSDDTSSTNEAVNTAHDVTAASLKRHASSSTYADDVLNSIPADNVPAGRSSSIPADYVSAGHVLMILHAISPSASPSFTQEIPSCLNLHTNQSLHSLRMLLFSTAVHTQHTHLPQTKPTVSAVPYNVSSQRSINADHYIGGFVSARNSPKRLGDRLLQRKYNYSSSCFSWMNMLTVQRENKVRTLLLQALPEDHMPDFHHYDDARDIWMAVKARFGGNEESKKMKKISLKQQFAEFSVTEEKAT
ncbi:hypothetical protein Tco_0328609 [Tanacetum coccineum]